MNVKFWMWKVQELGLSLVATKRLLDIIKR